VFVADRENLREHFKQGLNEDHLPPLRDLESRLRGEVQDRLERATRQCKNAYAKGERSYAVLEGVDPMVLMGRLPSFDRVMRILAGKL
jgi:hypothetical protein